MPKHCACAADVRQPEEVIVMAKERRCKPYRDRIVTDPDIMVGKPVVRGTRIPVEKVLDQLAFNPDLQELFAIYPELTVEDVKACLAYARRALQRRTAKRAHQSRRTAEAIWCCQSTAALRRRSALAFREDAKAGAGDHPSSYWKRSNSCSPSICPGALESYSPTSPSTG